MSVHYTEREERITRRVSVGFAITALLALWLFFSDHTLTDEAIFEMYGQGYEDWDEFSSTPSFKRASAHCSIFRCKTRIVFENRNPSWNRADKVVLADIHYWRWGHVYKVMYA